MSDRDAALGKEAFRLAAENKELLAALDNERVNAEGLRQNCTRMAEENERLKQGWETAFNIGVSEQEQNKKLRARIERLKAALKPFAQIADKFEHDGVPPTIAMLDCRRAQDVL